MKWEIGESNKKLQTIFDANVGFYQDLVKYILAGEQGFQEMDAYRTQMQEDLSNHPTTPCCSWTTMRCNRRGPSLDQRVQDLRMAENVGDAVHPHDSVHAVQQFEFDP